MAGIKTIYWDSCIFLALLKGEEHKAGESALIRQIATEFDAGIVNLITSTITLVEVLESTLDQETKDRFRKMRIRPNFTFIDANHEVCKLAGEIKTTTGKIRCE
jgi:PIN domain